MDIFQKIKNLNLKELMDNTLGDWKKEWSKILYKDPITKEKTASLTYFSEDKGWYSFWPSKWWDIIDFVMYIHNKSKWDAVKWFKAAYQIQSDENPKQKFEKIFHEDLWKKFDEYKMKGSTLLFSKWLWARWVQDKEKAAEVLLEIWVLKNLYLKTNTYADVIIFPCYDDKKIIWAKLRKADWSKFWNIKSKTITWSNTWLIYKNLDFTKTIYLCEWEADYVILKILGFKNVVGNLWWATSKIKMIWKLLIEAKEVVSFYDQDNAWLKGTKDVTKELNCKVIVPKFPKQWEEKIDVNDLYNKGFTYNDFLSLIEKEKESIDLDTVSWEIIKKEDGYYSYKNIQDVIKEVQITNFFMKLKDILIYPWENWKEDKRSIRFELISWWFKKIYEFKGKEIVEARTFTWKVAEINPLLCTYNVWNDSLQKLVRYLAEQNKELKETIVITKKGYLSKYNIRVFDNWIYSETEKKFFKYTLEDELVCELSDMKILFKWDTRTNVKYEKDYYDESILPELLSDSEYIFNGKQWHFVIWYFVSCLFFHKLKIDLTPFPLLFVAWKKSSWKTTAVQMFLQCFWFNHLLPESFEKSTPFVDQSDISELSAIPLWRDEYKNNNLCMRKDWFLKTVFDRSWISKWRIDLTKVHLPINAPLILSGEELPNDNAVFSRICSINVKAERADWNYEEIKARADYYWTFLTYFLANIEKCQKVYEINFVLIKKELIKEKVEKRLLNIYLPIITWIATYCILVFWNNYNIKEDIIDYYLKIIQSKQKEEQETDVINNFFDSLHNSYQKYELYESEWHITTGDNKININFSFLYNIYSVNETRNRRDPINQQSMKKYLLSELDGKTQRFYSWWRQKRGLQIVDNWKYEALTDLIDFLKVKKEDIEFNINKK